MVRNHKRVSRWIVTRSEWPAASSTVTGGAVAEGRQAANQRWASRVRNSGYPASTGCMLRLYRGNSGAFVTKITTHPLRDQLISRSFNAENGRMESTGRWTN